MDTCTRSTGCTAAEHDDAQSVGFLHWREKLQQVPYKSTPPPAFPSIFDNEIDARACRLDSLYVLHKCVLLVLQPYRLQRVNALRSDETVAESFISASIFSLNLVQI